MEGISVLVVWQVDFGDGLREVGFPWELRQLSSHNGDCRSSVLIVMSKDGSGTMGEDCEQGPVDVGDQSRIRS